MSSNDSFGRPGLQYPTDLHKESTPVQKATKMIVDNLFFLHKGVEELTALTGVPGQTIQQMITQTINNTIGGGGGGGGGGGATIIIHVGTHSVRLVSYGTASDPVGSLFIETDRTAIYYISDAMGPPAWVYAGGIMTAAVASIPTDLGVNDAGFSFVATDSTELTQYLWTGTVFITTGGLREIITDAVTAATSNVFRMAHRSSGIPAANFGGNVLTELDSSTNVLRAASGLNTIWSSATNAAETSVWSVQLRVLGAALADFFQVLSTGIRVKVGSFFGKFTHANSADRTYTFSDADGNITYETAALTSGNFLEGGGGAKVSDAGFSDIPFSRLVQASAASRLVGRGSASGAGDFEEITIGSGLSMSATTLSAAAVGGIWSLALDENGASLANWTMTSGSWSVVSSAFHVDTGALTVTLLRFTARIAQSAIVFTADVKMESTGGFVGGSRLGFVVNCDSGAGATNGSQVTLRCNGNLNPASTGVVYIESPSGVTAGPSGLTFLFNLDQFYTLKAVIIGPVMDIYVDGVYKYSLLHKIDPAASAVEYAYVSMYAFNCRADFQNIKMYSIILP